MYSEEIKKLLEIKKNIVSVKEYIEICNSTQITHVKYDNGVFYLWSNDDYKFILRIGR